MKTMQDMMTARFADQAGQPEGGLAVTAAYGKASNLGHWYVTRTDTLATVLRVRFDFQPERATFTLSGPALDQADVAAATAASGLPRGWVTRTPGNLGRQAAVTVLYAEAARYGQLLAAVEALLAPWRPGGQASRTGGQA